MIVNMIPNTIHLIFLRDHKLSPKPFPELFSNCMQRIKEMHPSWDVHLHNEQDALEVLEKQLPQYMEAYNSFKYNIQKVDFIRIAFLFIYGGFYMDLDMLCLKSLDSLRDRQLVLGEEKTISEAEQKALKLKNRLRIANYMFGGVAGHPFWLLLMKNMAALSTQEINTQQELLDITGPGLVTDLYHEHSGLYPDITLLRNTSKECIHPAHHEISCHFGEYAAHLHAGSWRTEILV